MTNPILALDGDNVLFDYSTAYAKAWERAFGARPTERDPTAYWPMHRWGLERLSGERLDQFRSCFDEAFWSTIPAVDGAIEACHSLVDAGFTLVCVSAIKPAFEQARLRNLQVLGFPIERVIATSDVAASGSPKARAVKELDALALVDDYLPYLCGLHESVHTALILRQQTGSPNCGPDMAHVKSQHADLRAFARWWLDNPDER